MRDSFHGSAHPGQDLQNAHRDHIATPPDPAPGPSDPAALRAAANDGTPRTPCTRNPADWSDPARRAFTRHQCLQCPRRRECAHHTLKSKPSHGMWAGIWINDDFTSKQHLLLEPAPPPAPAQPRQPSTTADRRPSPRTERRGRRVRVGKLYPAAPVPAVTALITARASGHCEIMAPACTYQQSIVFSRRRYPVSAAELASPADGLAACPNCVDLIEHTDIPTALDLGYLVDRRASTSTTAVFWRQHRWAYLDTRGLIHDINHPAQTHTAS